MVIRLLPTRHITPRSPFPTFVVGTGLRIRDLALAAEAGWLPNASPAAPVTGAIAESAIAHAIGVDTVKALGPGVVHADLRSLGMALAGPGTASLTPYQGAAYLARVFATDPAVQPLLAPMENASLGIRTMVETVKAHVILPLPTPTAFGSNSSGSTPAPTSPTEVTSVETLRVEMSPTPAFAARSITHAVVAGRPTVVRTIEILHGKDLYIEVPSAPGATTWYRLPPADVPNIARLIRSEAGIATAADRLSSLVHLHLVPGPAATIKLADAAHLTSLGQLFAAVPSAQSSLPSASLGLLKRGGMGIEMSGLTVYNAQTLWPEKEIEFVAMSIPGASTGQVPGAATFGETMVATVRVDVPVTITLPPQALNAPYLPGGQASDSGTGG